MGSFVQQFEAVVAAESMSDLFNRLEAGGDLVRIDPSVRPTAYHCATISPEELTQLRRLENIVDWAMCARWNPPRSF